MLSERVPLVAVWRRDWEEGEEGGRKEDWIEGVQRSITAGGQVRNDG